ncbi:MAG TPA: hypothetical protein VN843_12870 [Anaerolineales bacterium]|nr:hypothetical protein [Anaerolineales bacterium]
MKEVLWDDYVFGKQTLKQLGKKHGHSHIWVRSRLDQMFAPEIVLTPVPSVFITDTTFWGRTYGVCVFRSAHLKKNIWWNEVAGERMAHYHYGRAILEEQGWTFLAAVVDGRRGFLAVFKDIPVQICQFHQMKQVTKYLTRRPKTDAGKELRTLVLTLTETDEATFTQSLNAWHAKYGDFINQKTESVFLSGKKKWYYTHKNVRSAYRSLKTNLPNLFTYLKYPELNIPNTTNSLDGSFSALKKKLAVHHGLRRDRRYKVISQLLRDGA